jgi:bifunctional DNA-binding transcriptional regulator/antitoxin component of YhaV-PrlF toxin-antitoxin module
MLATAIMITGKLTSKAQTTIPLPVRNALRLVWGDEIAYVIEGDRVVLTKGPGTRPTTRSPPSASGRRRPIAAAMPIFDSILSFPRKRESRGQGDFSGCPGPPLSRG